MAYVNSTSAYNGDGPVVKTSLTRTRPFCLTLLIRLNCSFVFGLPAAVQVRPAPRRPWPSLPTVRPSSPLEKALHALSALRSSVHSLISFVFSVLSQSPAAEPTRSVTRVRLGREALAAATAQRREGRGRGTFHSLKSPPMVQRQPDSQRRGLRAATKERAVVDGAS